MCSAKTTAVQANSPVINFIVRPCCGLYGLVILDTHVVVDGSLLLYS